MTTTFHLLVHKDIGLTPGFSLSDYESMLPYEREIYASMMADKYKEVNKQKSGGR